MSDNEDEIDAFGFFDDAPEEEEQLEQPVQQNQANGGNQPGLSRSASAVAGTDSATK